MRVTFKSIFFQGGDTYGLAVRLGEDEQLRHQIAFPTTITPKEAVAKLRELARWIEQESKNAS
jgi:hypothetical protein